MEMRVLIGHLPYVACSGVARILVRGRGYSDDTILGVSGAWPPEMF